MGPLDSHHRTFMTAEHKLAFGQIWKKLHETIPTKRKFSIASATELAESGCISLTLDISEDDAMEIIYDNIIISSEVYMSYDERILLRELYDGVVRTDILLKTASYES